MSQAIYLGDILRAAAFQNRYGVDFRLHLLALYADPRCLNLRNRFAHSTAAER